MTLANPKQRMPTAQLARLRQALASVKGTRANFGDADGRMVQEVSQFGDIYADPVPKDDYVKEAIRLHHEIWIITELERVIAWGEGL